MTQRRLIIDWIKEHGFIIPARMGGKFYRGYIFGSETSKRCREMRMEGLLTSQKEGKFERYELSTLRQIQPSVNL